MTVGSLSHRCAMAVGSYCQLVGSLEKVRLFYSADLKSIDELMKYLRYREIDGFFRSKKSLLFFFITQVILNILRTANHELRTGSAKQSQLRTANYERKLRSRFLAALNPNLAKLIFLADGEMLHSN